MSNNTDRNNLVEIALSDAEFTRLQNRARIDVRTPGNLATKVVVDYLRDTPMTSATTPIPRGETF